MVRLHSVRFEVVSVKEPEQNDYSVMEQYCYHQMVLMAYVGRDLMTHQVNLAKIQDIYAFHGDYYSSIIMFQDYYYPMHGHISQQYFYSYQYMTEQGFPLVVDMQDYYCDQL